MHLEDLRTVSLIVELGSFSRAADYLLMAQSAISSRVRQVERELGFVLFTKEGRRAVPTPAGELVVEFAQRLDRDFVSLRQHLALLRDVNETLHIGTPRMGALWILPPLLAAVRTGHPELDIAVDPYPPEELPIRIRHGDIDLAVASPPDPELASEVMFRPRYYLVASVRHPLAAKAAPTCEEIAQFSFVAEPPGVGSRPILDAWASAIGLRFKVGYQVTGSPGVLAAIRGNLGIGLLMETAAASGSPRDELAVVPACGLPIQRELHVSYRRDSILSRPAELFLEVVRDGSWSEAVAMLFPPDAP